MAPLVWRFTEVKDDLDRLTIKSWVRDEPSDEWRLYQDGTLAQIMPLAELIEAARLTQNHRAGTVSVMLCGTVPTIGEIAPATHFKFELADPTTGKSIVHQYQSHYLPVAA
jgi:hypothetical protein